MADLTVALQAYWELGEASGTRNDSHGTNHLTDNNTVTQNTGIIGNAAEFTPANSEDLSIADNASLGYSGDFSFATWLYRGPSADNAASKGANSFAQNEWVMRVQFLSTGFGLRWTVFGTGGGSVNVTTADNTVPANTWCLGIGTFNAATLDMTVSVNAGTRATGNLALTPARKAHPFRLGSFGAAGFWGGRLDQAGFWKRVLTSGEETQLYNAGAGLSYAGILASAGGGGSSSPRFVHHRKTQGAQ